MYSYKDKNILVMGLARSGLAASRLLVKLGANVTVSEAKPLDKIEERDELASLGVRVVSQTPELFEEDFDEVIKNPGINGNLPVVKRLKERGIPVITEIELGFRVCAPQHFVAITGSNGKTTVTTMLYEVLKSVHGDKAHLSGNIGIALCDTILKYNLLEDSGHYIVLEISNFQLLDIDSFRPETAVIINLSPDHLDFMGTVDNYYRSKCRVYENMRGTDVFLLNADDAEISRYTEILPVKCRTVTYSTETEADVYADNENVYAFGKKIMPLSDIRVVGRHNVQNVLVCAGAALGLGVSAEQLARAVSEFRGVEHRIEFVRELDGVKYYNDSKGTNVDATVTALKAFSAPVILLAGGHEKGLSFDPLIPYMKGVKKIIAYGACRRRIMDELAGEKGIEVETLKEALECANSLAAAGDVILLSPTTSSFDQFSCFEERGDYFKELVNSL